MIKYTFKAKDQHLAVVQMGYLANETLDAIKQALANQYEFNIEDILVYKVSTKEHLEQIS